MLMRHWLDNSYFPAGFSAVHMTSSLSGRERVCSAVQNVRVSAADCTPCPLCCAVVMIWDGGSVLSVWLIVLLQEEGSSLHNHMYRSTQRAQGGGGGGGLWVGQNGSKSERLRHQKDLWGAGRQRQ